MIETFAGQECEIGQIGRNLASMSPYSLLPITIFHVWRSDTLGTQACPAPCRALADCFLKHAKLRLIFNLDFSAEHSGLALLES